MVFLNSTLTVIHPKVVENVFLKELQGNMVATVFLPERAINFPTFTYRRWGELGGMTPRSSEGAATRISSTEYSEELAKTIEYREGEIITEQAIKFYGNIRDIQLDAAEHLSDRLILRQEFNTITALTNNAANSLDLSYGSGTAWNESNSDPMDDLTEARRLIRKEGHISPDTLLINADVEADLLQSAAFKQWQIGGPMTQNPLVSGALEGARIRGLKIVVTDAFYLQDERTAKADETRKYLLENTAIAFKAGGDLGNTYISEAFQSRTFPVEDTRSFKMMVWKSMVPVVFRPQFICTIDNVRIEE